MPTYIPARTNYEGTALSEYPLDLRAAYPDTSFPPDIGSHNLTDEMIQDGVVMVLMVGQPVGDFASVTPGEPAIVDGEWRTTWLTVQRTVEQRRAQVAEQIDLRAKALRDQVVSTISAAEMSSWPIKQAQAEAFAASGDEADAPMLVTEAGYRECSVEVLVDKVLVKAEQLAGIEAAIAGECGRRQDLLKVADSDGIGAIAAGVLTGWPTVVGDAAT